MCALLSAAVALRESKSHEAWESISFYQTTPKKKRPPQSVIQPLTRTPDDVGAEGSFTSFMCL